MYVLEAIPTTTLELCIRMAALACRSIAPQSDHDLLQYGSISSAAAEEPIRCELSGADLTAIDDTTVAAVTMVSKCHARGYTTTRRHVIAVAATTAPCGVRAGQ